MKKLYDAVKELQTDKRYTHTIGVVKMALRLAEEYSIDQSKCELAALLHDVTKQVSKPVQLELLKNVDDQFILNNPPLWHSYTGAIYARERLGITDVEVLEAIKYHTTGKKGCTAIAKVIYLSDYLEQGRVYEPINEFRNLIGKVDLTTLYNRVAKSRIEYELNQGHQLHYLTKELYESII